MATFLVDTVIASFTAGAPLEPMAWMTRLLIPVFVLNMARAERKAAESPLVSPTREQVAA